MIATETKTSNESNWHYLLTALTSVRQALERRVADLQGNKKVEEPFLSRSQTTAESSFLLEQLCSRFRLSDFERDLLLLCVGMELNATFASLCADAQGDQQLDYPTFSLAMSIFAEPHWSAIAPHSPLRRWRLIEVGTGKTLTTSPLAIDERVLHYLIGIDYLDRRLQGIIEPISVSTELVPSHQQLAEQLAGILVWGMKSNQQFFNNSQAPIVQLCGDEIANKRAIACQACEMSGMRLAAMSALAVPTTTNDLNNLILLWEREVLLNQSVLLLYYDELEREDAARENAIAQLIGSINAPLIITSRDRRRLPMSSAIALDIDRPTKTEQFTLWQNALGEMAPGLNGEVESLVSQFNLNPPTIYAVCTEVFGRFAKEQENRERESSDLNASAFLPKLWDTCRAQSRPRLDDLAQRITPSASWEDLVLPEEQRRMLQQIAAHVRQRTKVYEKWGFASKSDRGLGISALFAGVSGTGKTMSAEVLAQELQLDLYRIDLSSVVSKYIGETEKNLRRIFDAAEGGATILLFDEADALFGKRSDVKDSHDRYANMEVSYLLQRMEAYQGLAILTTNLKDSLDTAFLRRIRFVVKFPFPDASERAEIWKRIFPKNTPIESLDFNRLARLNVAGGNIRNIALNAAFLAADTGEAVAMKHLLEAAQNEYVKLERTLTDAEVKGWL
ncbi:ATP-binding protein [Aerosakkonemataceae cyanobacterium BLCC-F50]|uniref:ATP-binding protein n=1 Tax=Floridaenema flaviceps BLCC-F50 TaxID=3153642 RepID=A0ABV4XJ65_9CYAN